MALINSNNNIRSIRSLFKVLCCLVRVISKEEVDIWWNKLCVSVTLRVSRWLTIYDLRILANIMKYYKLHEDSPCIPIFLPKFKFDQ